MQDDLAVVVEDENGEYRFQAGSVCTAGAYSLLSAGMQKLTRSWPCAAGFWRLQDKIGLALDEIHFGGAVPNYADKYQRSMNRFFSNLREDKLVERNNVRRHSSWRARFGTGKLTLLDRAVLLPSRRAARVEREDERDRSRL